MRIVFALIVSIGLSIHPAAGQHKKPASQSVAATENRTVSCGPQPTEAENQELRQDLQQMRSLLDQMQRNLAATATGETPLKQQFRLEIDMWQVLIRRMEKRLGESEQRTDQ